MQTICLLGTPSVIAVELCLPSSHGGSSSLATSLSKRAVRRTTLVIDMALGHVSPKKATDTAG